MRVDERDFVYVERFRELRVGFEQRARDAGCLPFDHGALEFERFFQITMQLALFARNKPVFVHVGAVGPAFIEEFEHLVHALGGNAKKCQIVHQEFKFIALKQAWAAVGKAHVMRLTDDFQGQIEPLIWFYGS